MTQMSWYVRMFEIYLSEKSSCLQCFIIMSKFFFNLSKNQCLHYHNTIVHGSSLIPQSSPIYAYLQKAALTLRLILEALPIPSRRHRLRVWVTYLSIKVLLRRSPGWVSIFFHKILTTLILNYPSRASNILQTFILSLGFSQSSSVTISNHHYLLHLPHH